MQVSTYKMKLKFKRAIKLPLKLKEGRVYLTITTSCRVYAKDWHYDEEDFANLRRGEIYKWSDIDTVYKRADLYFLYLTGHECTCEIRTKIQREEKEVNKYFIITRFYDSGKVTIERKVFEAQSLPQNTYLP